MTGWDNIAVIVPDGDIDLTTIGRLRQQLDTLLVDHVSRVVINCANVTYIDSSALAMLVSYEKKLQRAGGLLSLANTSNHIVRILNIAQLLEPLHVTAADKPPVPVLDDSKPPRWSKTFALQPDISMLGQYRSRIRNLLEIARMKPTDCFDMALAFGEALSNAYDHTCGQGIVVHVDCYIDRVIIDILDCGCGVTFEEDESPLTTEERGRGIKLMRLLADKVTVCKRTDGVCGTKVQLTKLIDL